MHAYLDHAATTPPLPEVVRAVTDVMFDGWANPSSKHGVGAHARSRIEAARATLAWAVRAAPSEIVFTGGGTEADNLAVLGAARAHGGRHLVVSEIEHKAVLEAAAALEREGFEVTRVHARPDGVVAVEDVLASVRPDTALVSLMLVNNEVGTIQPVAAVAQALRGRGTLVHTDAVQAFGKVVVDVRALGVDLLSLSAHKVHGPKGVGVLFVRRGVALAPLTFGGGQERGWRPGTENVAGAVGFACAVQIALEGFEANAGHVSRLRDELERRLDDAVPDLQVNGGDAERAPHILNLSVPDVEMDYVLRRLSNLGLFVSTGSACTSAHLAPSHVLRSMGVKRNMAWNAVRFSLSSITTEEEIDFAAETFARTVAEARGAWTEQASA